MNGSIKPQPRYRRRKQEERVIRRPVKYLVILMTLLLPAVLAFIWLRVQTVQLSYDIARAQQQKKVLNETNKKLRIELANLKSPKRIEEIALHHLGLRTPTQGQIEIIR